MRSRDHPLQAFPKHAGREFWSYRRSFGRVALTREGNPNLRDKAGREGFVENLYYLFLPALTLALSLSAILLRNLRDQLIEVMQAEYVGFAIAKGLPRRLVLTRHVLRNAWISTITLLGLHVGSLVGGAVITETVFAIPGVGRLMIDSIFARDYAVVQGLTMVLAILVSLVFVAVDAIQVMLDPRVAR